MSAVLIMFKKSFIIPKQDYEIFQNENYQIDDGTMHIFSKEKKLLLVEDTAGKPHFAVYFEEKIIENRQFYEISSIWYSLKKNIDPKNNFKEANETVWNALVEVLILLNDIISKRTKNLEKKEEIFEYIFYDNDTYIYDKTSIRNQRMNYLQALQEILFVFAVEE